MVLSLAPLAKSCAGAERQLGPSPRDWQHQLGSGWHWPLLFPPLPALAGPRRQRSLWRELGWAESARPFSSAGNRVASFSSYTPLQNITYTEV